MSLITGQFTATTSRQLVYQAEPDGSRIIIHNDEPGAGNTMYIGGPDLTASNGLHINGQEKSEYIILGPNDKLYVITASGTAAGSYLTVEV